MNTLRRILRKVDSVLQRYIYRECYEIKLKANGMLSPRVYATIYRRVVEAPDNDVVEIGSGRGAGTVVIARALKASGKQSKVIAVEKFEGGSNIGFGSKDENLARIHNIFDEFGVSDRIEIFPEYLTADNVGRLGNLIGTERLSCVVIDADGRLDIYLPALWPYLSDGCVIILDDYRENYSFREKSAQYPLGHTKELLCFRLVNKLVELGHLQVDELIDATIFARKRDHALMRDADLAALREQVESVEREHALWLRGHLAAGSRGHGPDIS